MERKPLMLGSVSPVYPMLFKMSSRNYLAEEAQQFFEERYGDKSGSTKKEAQLGIGPSNPIGNSVAVTIPQPYLPELASPDRLFFPSSVKQAMKYWRFFYALDPICGNIIDMYAEMLLSDMELSGEGVEGEIRDLYYQALEDTKALSEFRWMVVGYLVDGEVIPHLIWDDDKQRWVYLGFQDPMFVTVEDVPFIGVEPYLELDIPDKVKEILRSPDPKFQKFRDHVPNELLEAVLTNRPIILNNDNVTFIPRKLSPYDVRGVSVFSRIWRVLMFEDAIFNASIQTARRHSAPVKVVKLGHPTNNFIPSEEESKKFRDLLAVAETDPHAWIIYHYGVSFEAWGTTDRVMTISKEWETIERIKLIALGVSKAFLHGETTYACFVEGTKILTPDCVKNIEDISVGDFVIDKDGDIQKVENCWCEGIPEELVELHLVDGTKIQSTLNHRFPVFALPRTCACGCGESLYYKERKSRIKQGNCVSFVHNHHVKSKSRSWKEITNSGQLVMRLLSDYDPVQELYACDIRVGDYLMIPRKFSQSGLKDEDALFGRILGYYLAGGDVYKKIECGKEYYELIFTFGKDDVEDFYSNDLVECFDKLGLEASKTKSSNGCIKVTLRSRYRGDNSCIDFINKILSISNIGSANKSLSSEIMNSSLNFKKELIKGLFRGNGYLNEKRREIAFDAGSEVLAYQIRLILSQLGIACHLEKRPGKRDNRLSAYRISIRGKFAKILFSLVWGDVQLKINQLDDLNKQFFLGKANGKGNQGEKWDFWISDDFVFVKVKDVKIIKNKDRKKVFNLTISNSHSYLANGIATFNSAEKGLQVFLVRLQGLRTLFEDKWWYPKFFRKMAEKNDWIRPTEAELSHKVRTRRSKRELIEDDRYIIPKIVWSKSLDPQSKTDLVRLYLELSDRFGLKISRSEILGLIGLDWEEEEEKWRQEQKKIEELDKKYNMEEPEPAEQARGLGLGGPGLEGMPAPRPGVPGEGEIETGPVEAPETGEIGVEAVPGAVGE